MKKTAILMISCSMALCLAACGSENRNESKLQFESLPVTETTEAGAATEITEAGAATETAAAGAATETAAAGAATETTAAGAATETAAAVLTQEQALEAIKNYCTINNPDLKDMMSTDEYPIYWDVTTNDANEIVVLYRSYTAAQTRYYINPSSGETYVTELVPGIIDDEQRTDESFNVKDYLVPGGIGTSAEKTPVRRQDGERFEEDIMLEGMVEKVGYEHVRNETAGFDLDYEYESLERSTGSDSERFISRYDDQNNPENYLEVRYEADNAETLLTQTRETLSNNYHSVSEEYQDLDGAGRCVCLNASDAKTGNAGAMQRVYIIPAGDGCVIAEAHFTIESAEGFGARFSNIMNTLTILTR